MPDTDRQAKTETNRLIIEIALTNLLREKELRIENEHRSSFSIYDITLW